MRVVVADDNVLLREGIARILEDDGMEVVGRAATAEELLAEVAQASPDVAIVDIRMPPSHTDEGFRAALEIRARHRGTGVLLLSQYLEVGLAMKLLRDSAESVGYLLKDRVMHVAEFTAAVRRVGARGSAIDPLVVSQLLGRPRDEDPLEELTPREREVLRLMAEGRSNQGIADRLAIALNSVEKLVSSVFMKLALLTTGDDHRRVLAVLLYLRA